MMMATQTVPRPASKNDDVKEINARYRAYWDACQSNQLEKVPSFWSLPALFAVDTGEPETSLMLLKSPEEMIKLYSTLFGASTGVDKTVIDSSEVTFYGDKLATIKTSLRHLAGSKLHDRQDAIYGCRKVNGEWAFISHLSLDATE
jgi:ketosteroid isomerase-like protein